MRFRLLCSSASRLPISMVAMAITTKTVNNEEMLDVLMRPLTMRPVEAHQHGEHAAF